MCDPLRAPEGPTRGPLPRLQGLGPVNPEGPPCLLSSGQGVGVGRRLQRVLSEHLPPWSGDRRWHPVTMRETHDAPRPEAKRPCQVARGGRGVQRGSRGCYRWPDAGLGGIGLASHVIMRRGSQRGPGREREEEMSSLWGSDNEQAGGGGVQPRVPSRWLLCSSGAGRCPRQVAPPWLGAQGPRASLPWPWLTRTTCPMSGPIVRRRGTSACLGGAGRRSGVLGPRDGGSESAHERRGGEGQAVCVAHAPQHLQLPGTKWVLPGGLLREEPPKNRGHPRRKDKAQERPRRRGWRVPGSPPPAAQGPGFQHRVSRPLRQRLSERGPRTTRWNPLLRAWGGSGLGVGPGTHCLEASGGL